ncbi:MAG: hypothetical protein ACTHU0_05020 [Kofleriaceae bacterium]
MSNRKATFAKRQRETDLKDHAKAKEERRANRRSQPRTSKGPEIAWDEAVNVSITPYGEGPAPAPPGVDVPPNPNAASAAPGTDDADGESSDDPSSTDET